MKALIKPFIFIVSVLMVLSFASCKDSYQWFALGDLGNYYHSRPGRIQWSVE